MNNIFAFQGIVLLGEWSLVATAILLVTWLVTIRVRRNAAMRHLTWLIAFSSLLVAPAIVSVVPTHFAIQIPIVRRTFAAPSLPGSPANEFSFAGATRVERNSPDATRQPLSRRIRFDTVLLGLWLAGVGAVAILGAVAAYGITTIRRQSVQYELDSLDMAELSAKAGLKRDWELRVSSGPNPPAAITWGFLRPVIVLPKNSIFWPKHRLEAVLLHELAHARRYDTASQRLGFTVCALYWFHPAVWRSARAMRMEAELAADAAVVISGIKPSAYAGELLQFASQLRHRRPPFGYPGVSFMRQSRIETRIESILKANHGESAVTSVQALKGLALGLSTVFLLAWLRPSFSFANVQQAAGVPAAAAIFSPGVTEPRLPLEIETKAADSDRPARRVAARRSEAKICPKVAARRRANLQVAQSSTKNVAERNSQPD